MKCLLCVVFGIAFAAFGQAGDNEDVKKARMNCKVEVEHLKTVTFLNIDLPKDPPKPLIIDLLARDLLGKVRWTPKFGPVAKL